MYIYVYLVSVKNATSCVKACEKATWGWKDFDVITVNRERNWWGELAIYIYRAGGPESF